MTPETTLTITTVEGGANVGAADEALEDAGGGPDMAVLLVGVVEIEDDRVELGTRIPDVLNEAHCHEVHVAIVPSPWTWRSSGLQYGKVDSGPSRY